MPVAASAVLGGNSWTVAPTRKAAAKQTVSSRLSIIMPIVDIGGPSPSVNFVPARVDHITETRSSSPSKLSGCGSPVFRRCVTVLSRWGATIGFPKGCLDRSLAREWDRIAANLGAGVLVPLPRFGETRPQSTADQSRRG
jgi:hypothetical protein